MEKAALHTLQCSAKKRLKVQNTEFLKQRFHGKKFSFDKYLCLLPDNLAKCGVDCKQHKCSSERKISSVMLLEQDLQKTGMGFTVFKTYLPEFLSKLVEKLASFMLYRCCGEICRRQSTTEILRRKENFKRSDIKNKIYKKPVSASQL